MGTLAEDIKDVPSALDFFAAYAPQEGELDDSYQIRLLHAGDQTFRQILDFASAFLARTLHPAGLPAIPAELRPRAVIYFASTLGKRSGAALRTVRDRLATYPIEIVSEKFNTTEQILHWLNEGCPPYKLPPPPPPGPVELKAEDNLFGVEWKEETGIVFIRAWGQRLSPTSARHLAAKLIAAAPEN